MSTYAGSSSTHARDDIVSQNDQLSPRGSISSRGPPRSRSLVESVSNAEREHGATHQIETYSREQDSSRATNTSGSASPGIGFVSQFADQQQQQLEHPSRSTPPTRTSFDEMYSQTPRLSVTDGDLDVLDRADEEENGAPEKEDGPVSVQSFDTGRNNQINDDHQNSSIRSESAPPSTPIVLLQSRLSIPSSQAVGRHVNGVGSRQSTPPPTTNHILHPFERTRGRHETSNTRAAGSTPMTSTKYAAENRDDDATRAMSTVEAYNRIFERLGTVAFFGASIAWASVFGAQRGNVLSLAWSASLFMSASVIAGSASLITYSDQINIERDMFARRVLRALAVCTAGLALAGICMLCVASFDLDTIPDELDGRGKGRTRAPGIFTLAVSGVAVGCAVALRVAYSNNLYRYRF